MSAVIQLEHLLSQAAVVSQMIQPAVREADVTGFFWGHLHKDLQVLQHVLGRCCDDVYLLLHHLCHQLAELPSGQSRMVQSSGFSLVFQCICQMCSVSA